MESVSCAYCDSREPSTRDHIPPLAFFPKPRAANLVTVPCCEPCREGWSKDDEYFRFVVLNSEELEGQELARQPIQSMLRSLRKIGKTRFTDMVGRSLGAVNLRTEGGILLGTKPALEVDGNRLGRVGERIVRGLFFHEVGKRVPDTHNVHGRLRQGDPSHVLEPMGNVKFPPFKRIQDGVFSYTWLHVAEDRDSTVWLMLFYERLPMFGFTQLQPDLRNA